MSPTNRHKYKYFRSTVQRAKYSRQKFHFCRLPFDVRPPNVKLNLSNQPNLKVVIIQLHASEEGTNKTEYYNEKQTK